jgi:arylformamidase
MSDSESPQIEITGRAKASLGLAGLSDALGEVFDGLITAGCGPQHLVRMVWTAPEPGLIHPARHLVDLAYREVFAGFRPPVELRPDDGADIMVQAFARPTAPSGDIVFADYSAGDLGRQYSPRGQANMKQVFQQWTRDGHAFRARHAALDLAYGSSVYETFDLFMPDHVARPPLWIFIHGGYWQASDKAQHAQFAQGMLHAGYAVAMPNYGLAPDTSLSEIVAQLERAFAFLRDNAGALGFDTGGFHLAGHSAGAHLAAMMAIGPHEANIRSALLLSGLFDLAPLGFLPVGRLLGLDDPAFAASLSPVTRAVRGDMTIALAVGARESDEFKRQSALLADRWNAPPALVVPDAHHFSLLDGLNGGALLDLARATAKP